MSSQLTLNTAIAVGVGSAYGLCMSGVCFAWMYARNKGDFEKTKKQHSHRYQSPMSIAIALSYYLGLCIFTENILFKPPQQGPLGISGYLLLFSVFFGLDLLLEE